MGTVDHTPHGRGYHANINCMSLLRHVRHSEPCLTVHVSSTNLQICERPVHICVSVFVLMSFYVVCFCSHHANDYWSSVTGGCPKTVPPGPPTPCKKMYPTNFCLGGADNVPATPSQPNPAWFDTAAECCALCSTVSACHAWAFGKSSHGGKFSCYLKSTTGPTNEGNCSSACRFGPCHSGNTPIVDLWQKNLAGDREGPAHGLNSTCKAGALSDPTPGSNTNCHPGPQGDHRYDGYEDALFEVGRDLLV